jgi:hypothetical protein
MAGKTIRHVDQAVAPAIEKRLRNVYKRHGAKAARSLAEKILHKRLDREELRFLLWLETDDEGYARAVDAHRLAWDQAGWKARSWWKQSADDPPPNK